MDSFEAVVEPYCRSHDLYQTYYRASIAECCRREGIGFRETGARFPGSLRFLRRVRDSGRFGPLNRIFRPLTNGVARLLGARPAAGHPSARYLLHAAGGDIRIGIDAHDSGTVKPELLDWSDLYFKTNYWPHRDYPAKVLPLANVNPEVLTRRKELIGYRSSETEWDLFGFFRVWGGKDEIEGVEHNLALFEALAGIKCRKKLLAYLVAGDIAGAAARLEKAGVAWTTEWMPLKQLWGLAARSKLNVVRHGMHECIPWRMTDMLAMGHCPVLDYRATTRWHVPLLENVHYLNLDFSPGRTMSPRVKAERVAERVQGWLADKDLIATVGRNAAAYFDEHLAPERLGAHIVNRARGSSQLKSVAG